MKAKSQEYNDNTGGNTDLCFHCRTYYTLEDFNTSEGKNICKNCFKEYEKLCKKLGVQFIDEDRNQEHFSHYHKGIIDHKDVYALIGNKKVFIRGYVPKESGTEIDRAEIFNMKIQFLKSNLNYFTFHCGAWLDELKKREPISPIEFIKWIKENNYNFGHYYGCSIEYLEDYDLYDFSGNLDKVSCSFHFRIYSKEYYQEIVEILKDSYFKNIELKGG